MRFTVQYAVITETNIYHVSNRNKQNNGTN